MAILFAGDSQPLLAARTWYVAGVGNDSQDGTTVETAFRSLKKAAANVRPGDTVLIEDGIYANEAKDPGGAVVDLDQQGSPDSWTTWKAAPGAHPELRPTGWNGIFITGSYIILDGLKVTGANDSITLVDA